MKKYITLAALLAAGTTFANAEEVDFTLSNTDGTIAFNIIDGDSASLFSLSYTSWSYDGSGAHSETGGFQSPSNSAYQNTFSPDGQLRSGQSDSWTMNFTFQNNGTEAIVLSGFTFDCYGINGGGSDKNAAIQVTTTLSSGASTWSNTVEEYTLAYAGNTSGSSFTLDNVTLDAGESMSFSFKMSDAKTYNTYAGITGGSFTYNNIPEPSAFGLLAGVGALALTASRRRRK